MTQDRGTRFSALVGAELKGAIRARGWLNGDVAVEIGIHEVTLSRYLNGHRLLPVSVLSSACEAIGVLPDEIVDRAYMRLIAEMGPAPASRLDPADAPATVHPLRTGLSDVSGTDHAVSTRPTPGEWDGQEETEDAYDELAAASEDDMIEAEGIGQEEAP